jgi:hypothetical protein
MAAFQAHPNEVFPFTVSGCKTFAEGASCRLQDALDVAPLDSWLGSNGTVSVSTTSLSVKFTVTSRDYFDSPGSTIVFSTYKKGGNVWLRQTAYARATKWWAQVGVALGGARDKWKTQTRNLRALLRYW